MGKKLIDDIKFDSNVLKQLPNKTAILGLSIISISFYNAVLGFYFQLWF